MLDGVLICIVVALIIATGVTWLRFFAWTLSFISEGNRLDQKVSLKTRIATFGFTGFFQMMARKEYRHAWFGFGKAFSLAAISFMALMGTTFLLMPPSDHGCRMSVDEWKHSLGQRIVCVNNSKFSWSK